MPNRILKNSICDSENIAQLKPEEEVFFYRILVNCDDFGRLDARIPVLIAKCYPLKITEITNTLIQSWLEALTSAELIEIYYVSKQPYLKVKKWENHQSIRAKKSKYPSPDDNGHGTKIEQIQASEITCNQEQSDESKCPRIRIRNPIYIRESNPITDDGFSEKEKTIIDLYSNNISVNVTPIIVEELQAIAETYDLSWVEYAIGEAVKHNAHNLKYVKTILENCAIKGFIPTNNTQKENPRKVVYKELT